MDTRDVLEEIAVLQRELPDRRAEAVEVARAEGMTWRQIAGILGMTEHGVIKAQAAYRERLAGRE